MKLVMVALSLLLLSASLSAGDTTDYVFIHKGDGLTITDHSGENRVEFEFYSISGRSRIDVPGPIIFKNTDGWQSTLCTVPTVRITVQETGTNKPSKDSNGVDIPGCSDLVIRVSNSYEVENIKGEDTKKWKGKNCTVCKTKIEW